MTQIGVKLPRVEPSITSIPTCAHLVSILEAYEEHNLWLMQNFLMLRATKFLARKNCIAVDFYNLPNLYDGASDFYTSAKYFYAPNLDIFSIPLRHHTLPDVSSVVELILHYLDKKCYVNLVLDVSCIEYYQVEQSSLHTTHDPLVYGYNPVEKLFYLADFVDGDQYQAFTCTFEEMSNAFRSYIEMFQQNTLKDETKHIFNRNINIIKYEPAQCIYNPKQIEVQLYNHIHPSLCRKVADRLICPMMLILHGELMYTMRLEAKLNKLIKKTSHIGT